MTKGSFHRPTVVACDGHYPTDKPAPPTREEKIGALIEPGGDGECWAWLGKTNENGYPRFGRTSVHRYIYETLVGPIPAKHHVHHVCRNRSCVNPRHLRTVTPKQHAEAHSDAA